MKRDVYLEVWRCAKCRASIRVPELPLSSPVCERCKVGMWWSHRTDMIAYTIEDANQQR